MFNKNMKVFIYSLKVSIVPILMILPAFRFFSQNDCYSISAFVIPQYLIFSLYLILFTVMFVAWSIESIKDRKTLKWNGVRISLLFVSLLASYKLLLHSNDLETKMLEKSTDNARPLIAALESYKTKNGKYPEKLLYLIPGFMKEIPKTTHCGRPDFIYRIRGSQFELGIRHGAFANNILIYEPISGKYTVSYKRTGQWAYIHAF